MASVSKKRKQWKDPDGKGKDKFLTNRRSSRGASGYNSSKRQDIKNAGKKEADNELSDMKHLGSFTSFSNR